MFGEPIQYSKDWQYVLPADISESLQKAIDSAKAEKVHEILKDIVEWMKSTVPDITADLYFFKLESDLADLTPDYISNFGTYEERIDHSLNDLYDICDLYRIYLDLEDDETSVETTTKAEADWVLNSSIKSQIFGDTANREYFTDEEFQQLYTELLNQGYMEECSSTEDKKCLWKLNPVDGDTRLEFERVDRSK